jgi:hypothetical protein
VLIVPGHDKGWNPDKEKKDQAETNGREESGSAKNQEASLEIDIFRVMEKLADFHASKCDIVAVPGQSMSGKARPIKTVDKNIPP